MVEHKVILHSQEQIAVQHFGLSQPGISTHTWLDELAMMSVASQLSPKVTLAAKADDGRHHIMSLTED